MAVTSKIISTSGYVVLFRNYFAKMIAISETTISSKLISTCNNYPL